jgi:hypothetical protein
MATVVEIEPTMEALLQEVRKEMANVISFPDSALTIKPYGDYYVVEIQGFGVYGFTDGPLAFKSGDFVRTARALEPRDFTLEGQMNRRCNTIGTVVADWQSSPEHNSHGLCYDVRHVDGSLGCYDPDEITLEPKE